MNHILLDQDLPVLSATLISRSWREINRLNVEVALSRQQIRDAQANLRTSVELLSEIARLETIWRGEKDDRAI
jgi:hypothetical protein